MLRKLLKRSFQAWTKGARLRLGKLFDTMETLAVILFVIACIALCSRFAKRCDAMDPRGPTIGSVIKIAGC